MWRENSSSVKTMCINQLIRPKISIPKWMRADGCGDCTVCEPSKRNSECKNYVPMVLVGFNEKKN